MNYALRWLTSWALVMSATACGGKTSPTSTTSAGTGATAGAMSASGGSSGGGGFGGRAGGSGSSQGGAPGSPCVPLAGGNNVVATGCCHDPCVEGEKCSATYMNGGPQYKKCVCSAGALVCCEMNQFIEIGCGADTECPALGAGAPCRGCCASRFTWMDRTCLCTDCAAVCPEACPKMATEAVLSVGCATCLAGRIGQCQLSSTSLLTGCFSLCGPP